jgi:hypothetical protein
MFFFHHLVMKRKLLCLLLSFVVGTFLKAQTAGSVKLYAYKQSVIRGKAPGGIFNEDEQAVETKRRSSANYFIYATSTATIYPVELWLNGVQYGVTAEPVTATPIEINETDLQTKKILVPKTTRKVIRLIPKENTTKKSFEKGKELSKDNVVVVVYKMEGKFYYKAVKTFSSLSPQVMQ